MTTEMPSTETTATELTEEEARKLANDQLREYADRTKARASGLETRVMKSELASMGLTPDEGLGLAIAEGYDGTFEEGDIVRFATEKYKYEPPEVVVPPVTVETARDRVDEVMAAGAEVTPPEPVDEVVEADAKLVEEDATRQDAQRSLSHKLNRYKEIRSQLQ